MLDSMALRGLITAVLLFAAAAAGHYASGQRRTPRDVVLGPTNSDIPVSSVSPQTVNGVYKRGSNAKFVGLNIAGFDFGW